MLRRFTPEEYLQLERASRTKSEYIDGFIYAMAGGTANHDDVTVNAITLLRNQLRGGKCRVHSSDFRIAMSDQGPYFYPDVSVICGKHEFLDNSLDCALNPSVVIEVLSKSTRKYDRETKVSHYREIPTLQHIVLVSQFSVSVDHHWRVAGGKWKAEKHEDRRATLDLRAIGAALPLADLYEGLSFHSRA